MCVFVCLLFILLFRNALWHLLRGQDEERLKKNFSNMLCKFFPLFQMYYMKCVNKGMFSPRSYIAIMT